MTIHQERKLSMYEVVEDYMENLDPQIIGSMPKMADNLLLFSGKVAAIKSMREQQELQRGGIADNKQALEDKVVKSAADIARKVRAYALNEDDAVLAEEVNYSQTDLERSADTILRDQCQVIHDRADAFLAALADYGITKDLLGLFQADIDNFNAAIPKPRTGVVSKKDATEGLAALFRETDLVLVKMDALAEMLRVDNSDFYGTYKNSRLTTDAGRQVLAVRGTVREGDVPIANVTVTVDGQAGRYKTSEKGNFQVKVLPAGEYNFRFAKSGFADGKALVNVTDGERSEVEVVLARK